MKIEYDEAPEIPEGAELSVVHFADEGTEVITDLDVNEDATEIVYEQESFSVTATVIAGTPDHIVSGEGKGDPYYLTAKVGDDVYVVERDGSLTKVSSYTTKLDGSVDKIVADSTLMWSYFQSGEDFFLRYASKGYDYSSDKQARTFAYTYLDPTVDTGITPEVPQRDEHGNIITVYNGSYDETQFISPKTHCAVTITDKKIQLQDLSGKYIGAVIGADGKSGEDRCTDRPRAHTRRHRPADVGLRIRSLCYVRWRAFG